MRNHEGGQLPNPENMDTSQVAATGGQPPNPEKSNTNRLADSIERIKGPESDNENPTDKPEIRVMDVGRQRLNTIKSGWKSFQKGFADRFKGVGKGLEKAVVGMLAADKAGEKAWNTTRSGVAEGGKALGREAVKGTKWVGDKATKGRDWTAEKANKGLDWADDKIMAGEDWAAQKAGDIYNGSVEAYHRCSNRIGEIQKNFKLAMERKRKERQDKADYKEYQKLLAWQKEMTAKFQRLEQLGAKFSGQSAE